MLDFDYDDPRLSPQIATAPTEAPELPVEETRVRPSSAQGSAYKAKPVSDWNWSDLRDYIAVQIEERHGPQVRDALKESGIVKGFIQRWGIERAHAIAVAAFDVHDGMWRNAPIAMGRFSKNSDPYFASVIAENL